MSTKQFQLNRRDLLRAGFAGGLMGALARPGLSLPRGGPDHKVLVIFLRGAYDAVNTVIPHGDLGYTLANRGSTFIDPNGATPPLGI
ncbi:MAG: hypothetical protein KUG81_04260, partial [Gammaproteobacteria bacterium]|nr:hypothetical protein [Gammaproteobacteria bacterium]